MNTDISAPGGGRDGESHAEKERAQISPQIREVWNALTHPLFLLDPRAARAYDGFMLRLRSVIENGEEGVVWAISVLETAKHVMDNTMLEQAVLNRYQQQRSYIRRNAASEQMGYYLKLAETPEGRSWKMSAAPKEWLEDFGVDL